MKKLRADIHFGPQACHQLAGNLWIQSLSHQKRSHFSASPDALRRLFNHVGLPEVFLDALVEAEKAAKKKIPDPNERFIFSDTDDGRHYPFVDRDQEIVEKRTVQGYPDTIVKVWACDPR
jgi:hypothetical protein